MTLRIIPRLDIKGPNLVKGIQLEGLRVLGKPENFARYYYEHGADELLFMDTVASLYGRNHLGDIIQRVASDIFIPLCVGGGLRKLDDIRAVLLAGADKVAINTQAIRSPELISQAANLFGSSTIVVAVEVIRQPDGSYQCFTDNGREATGLEAISWAKQAAELGAGELLITSVDRDGTGKGFDLDFLGDFIASVNIPVIVHGGAGSISHAIEATSRIQFDAMAVASLLHYDAIQKITYDTAEFADEGNIEFIKNGGRFGKIQPCTLEQLKCALHEAGIDVRPSNAGNVI